MIETVQHTNLLVAYGGLLMLLMLSVVTFDLFTNRSLVGPIRRFGLQVAFVVSLAATALTLTYSEVYGFVPCGLCWMQRVFMFPQVLIAGTGIVLRDRMAAYYGMLLAAPGLAIALYQHYLQMGGSEFITCPSAGGGDCAERILFEFGFMTFPLLAAILFAFLLVLYWYYAKITE